jgi:hypothetical protein
MPAVSNRRLTDGTVTVPAKTNAAIATKVNISVKIRGVESVAVMINRHKAQSFNGVDCLRQ